MFKNYLLKPLQRDLTKTPSMTFQFKKSYTNLTSTYVHKHHTKPFTNPMQALRITSSINN